MRYRYHISFEGEVAAVPPDDAEDERDDGERSLHEAQEAVRDSFAPDLLHGVTMRGMNIDIRVIEDAPPAKE
jgi:hypothetical protein